MLYGSFNPRRRQPPRREDDPRFHSLDWHASHLLAVAIGILLLSVADAFMTVTLLAGGAVEVNPIMALIVYRSAAVFAAVKMTMTGVGVMLMVLLARYRLLRVVRVDVMMYGILFGYFALLSYEFRLTRELVMPFGF
jgi:sensor histidine kinase YesM